MRIKNYDFYKLGNSYQENSFYNLKNIFISFKIIVVTAVHNFSIATKGRKILITLIRKDYRQYFSLKSIIQNRNFIKSIIFYCIYIFILTLGFIMVKASFLVLMVHCIN